MSTASALDACVPSLPAGVRLRHDLARDRWVMLAPDRVFVADPPAVSVLRLVDGQRGLGRIIETLSEHYAAPREVIAADVAALLADLAEKRLVVWAYAA